ncbi:MAG TPA: hypothetical protein VFX04_04105, partial [Rhodanobacteraceae bacterium]|nr:hypothetical protein [Rhodanobacteraceae bacterium]
MPVADCNDIAEATQVAGISFALARMFEEGMPMSAAASVERHPRKAFLVLFFIEVWERFGY